MSEKTTPNDMAEDMPMEHTELDDAQLEKISGGQFIPGETRYVCDNCGAECDFVDVNHNFIPIFECPKCGNRYLGF